MHAALLLGLAMLALGPATAGPAPLPAEPAWSTVSSGNALPTTFSGTSRSTVSSGNALPTPDPHVGTGTATWIKHDRDLGVTTTCPDEKMVATITQEPGGPHLRFQEGVGNQCHPTRFTDPSPMLGWGDGMSLEGTPETGYTYSAHLCDGYLTVVIGPLGEATSFYYEYDQHNPCAECFCPRYEITATLDFVHP